MIGSIVGGYSKSVWSLQTILSLLFPPQNQVSSDQGHLLRSQGSEERDGQDNKSLVENRRLLCLVFSQILESNIIPMMRLGNILFLRSS